MINAENFVNSFHGNSDEIFILSNAKKKKKKRKKKKMKKVKNNGKVSRAIFHFVQLCFVCCIFKSFYKYGMVTYTVN